MVPSIKSSHPGPEAAKLPQTIPLPPPYLTVDEVLTVKCSVWFSPGIMGTISSIKLTQVCQNAPGWVIKTFGRMLYGQMGPIMPGKKQTLHSNHIRAAWCDYRLLIRESSKRSLRSGPCLQAGQLFSHQVTILSPIRLFSICHVLTLVPLLCLCFRLVRAGVGVGSLCYFFLCVWPSMVT